MKLKDLIITTVVILTPLASYGSDHNAAGRELQAADSTNSAEVVAGTYLHRKFQQEMYEQVYSNIPSMLGLWGFGEYAHISGGYSLKEGDFRDLQGYSGNNEAYIGTSSVMRLEKGWTLYGRFGYVNGNSENVKYNLSYDKDSYGSPYYYIMKAPGDWSYQKYLFEASFAKEIKKDKLFAGASISYRSTLNFRTVDYRNEQYDLHLSAKPSLTYVLGKYSVSAGADIVREKREPDIYSRYQQSNAGDEYQLYINTGVGSYIKNAPQSTTSEIYGMGPALSFSMKEDRRELVVNYAYTIYNQDLRNKLTSTISELGEELGEYNASVHKLNASFLNLNDECKGYKIIANASLTKGDASQFNNVSGSFLKNYTTDRYDASLNASLFDDNAFLSKVFLEGGFISERNFDMNYGQEYSFSNLKVAAGLSTSLQMRKGGEFTLSAGAEFNKNLDITHDPVSAADIFITKEILYPLLAYRSADWWGLSAEVVWSKFIMERYCADIVFFANLEKPYKINYSNNSAQFDTEDSFGSAGVKLVFNF